MHTILICDDEKDICSALEIYLRGEGYATRVCGCGEDALRILREEEIHLVLLDIMMPGMDGVQTLTALRAFSNVPVLMLTARGEDADKVLGLTAGADDYIVKPFRPAELIARVRSHLRRYTLLGSMPAAEPDVYRVGGIELSEKEKSVTLDGEPVAVTRTEFEILKLLMASPGQVFSPRQIYQAVWNETYPGAEATVAVHIRHLREKLEYDPAQPRHLRVVWGHGYRITDK